MTLSFDNPSRSFDANKRLVQFWGYDSAFEISFYVEVGALKLLCPGIDNAETGFLQAFDTKRDRIVEVADDIYTSGKKRRFTFVLTANDFKS